MTITTDALDREYRTVHDDVTLLADYGLVFVVEDGRGRSIKATVPPLRTDPPRRRTHRERVG
ncbi:MULTISPECIES: hypothetical protein [Haloferacaceae]|uniref:Uncharacterized protein n=1 Tax=Halorubrum glutamatedens TaxID=2707018 RepID=A0ABD5QND5_9EURY|nr:hypothetical protein [Halobellus captivus]